MNIIKLVEDLSLSNLRTQPEEFWNSIEAFNEIVNQEKMEGIIFSQFSHNIQNDPNLVIKAIKGVPYNFLKHPLEFVSDEILSHRDVAYAAISKDFRLISHFNSSIKSDIEFLKNIISTAWVSNGFLRELDDSVKSDLELVTLIVKKDPQSYEFISEDLKSNTNLLFSAMFDHGLLGYPQSLYSLSSLEIRSDLEFYDKIKNAASKFKAQRGSTLKELESIHRLALAETSGGDTFIRVELEEELKYYKTMFIKNFSYMKKSDFEDFHNLLLNKLPNFGDDKEIMEKAILVDFKQSSRDHKPGASMLNISKSLLSDREFIDKIMKLTDGDAYPFLLDDTKTDSNFIIQNFSLIKPEHLDVSVGMDKDLIKSLYKINSYKCKKVIDRSLLVDINFVEKLAEIDIDILSLSPIAIRSNREFMDKFIEINPNVLKYAEDELLCDPDLVMKAFKFGGYRFVDRMGENLLSDKSFMLSINDNFDLMWEQRGKSWRDTPYNFSRNLIKYSSYDLKKDLDFICAFIGYDGWAINYVDDSIKYNEEVLRLAFASGSHVQRDLDIDKIKELYPDNWIEIVGKRIDDI